MNKKKLLIIAGLIIILGIGYYLLSPLWRNKTLDDPLPVASTLDDTTRTQLEKEVSQMQPESKSMQDSMPPSNTGIVAEAPMVKASYDVEGKALLVNTGESQVLRFENFKTTNGPDLKIYLATDTSASEYVDLGAIKANEGNINYEIPQGTDVGKYKYALVWCRAFSVLFSYAELK